MADHYEQKFVSYLVKKNFYVNFVICSLKYFVIVINNQFYHILTFKALIYKIVIFYFDKNLSTCKCKSILV